MNNIKADEIILGKNVIISPKASIKGLNGNAKKIIIGDNTYIGDDVQIIIDELSIGDYCKIHHHTNIHGYKPVKIGHNAWVGQYSIIDGVGGTTIGDNCGIGAHSQLWSHILYGDDLEGCNYNSNKNLIIGNDCWFVGHCIVSPIIAEDKSMALIGSVITKDMKKNHIYGGSPAKDLTDKLSPQFREVTIEEKYEKMMSHYKTFNSPKSIKIILDDSEIISDEYTYFNVANRKYTKKLTDEEISFMKYLLPTKAKFTPYI
jgi:acetyltransferase-like isoleucine patch superfamily enzyme